MTLMLQGATGAALVFQDRMLMALNQELLVRAVPATAAPPRVDRILTAVDRELNTPGLDRVVFPQGRRTAAMVYLPTGQGSRERVLVSDPRTGRVLGEIKGIGMLPFLLFRVHDELTMGDLGHALLIVEGLGLLFLGISGLMLAGPSRRAAWRVRWRGGRLQRSFDLHRVAGLTLAGFLAIMAPSGVMLEADFLFTGDAPAPASRASPVDWSHLMTRVWDVSREYPGQAVEDVRFSSDQSTATIGVDASDVSRPQALDRIDVALASGQVVAVRRAADESWVRCSLDWIYLIHSGTVWGPAGGAWALVGVGLFTVPLLGALLWLRRRSAVPARARARAPN